MPLGQVHGHYPTERVPHHHAAAFDPAGDLVDQRVEVGDRGQVQGRGRHVGQGGHDRRPGPGVAVQAGEKKELGYAATNGARPHRNQPRRGRPSGQPSSRDRPPIPLPSAAMPEFTVPGLFTADSATLADPLQKRLTACNDLHFTLKHVHWNAVGPNFISVHEMLDPQVELVRGFADVLAERVATLGGSSVGTMGANADHRSWDDYSLGRDTAQAHLGALDKVYDGVVGDHRKAIAVAGEVDPVTEDMLLGQTAELEKFQWFIRAHLENAAGNLPTADDVGEGRRPATRPPDSALEHDRRADPSPRGAGPFCGATTSKIPRTTTSTALRHDPAAAGSAEPAAGVSTSRRAAGVCTRCSTSSLPAATWQRRFA